MTTPSHLELANAIRALSMDAVQQANSGHPGMPMGMADIAEVLWRDFMCFDPANPDAFNRDRFVLSNGHGCMLLYSVLYLTGFDLSIEDIKQFRQLGSKTPGHPEFGDTPGVASTTGPLGQGLGHAVGMAIAERHMAATFNRPGHALIDHTTYAFAGDGCLMEGISHEVCSLAGTLGLGKLIVFYDDNDISIDGKVNGWFTDDTGQRFEAYGWQVIRNVDGHDRQAIVDAIHQAKHNCRQPTLIQTKTVIGWGAPNAQGSAGCHGAPLGDAEIAQVRKQLDWPHAPFEIPDAVKQAWDCRERGGQWMADWEKRFDDYQQAFPTLAKALTRRLRGELPDDWQAHMQQFCQRIIDDKQPKAMATRKASKQVLDSMTEVLPELLGGSADLTGSNLTQAANQIVYSAECPQGTYLHYGVREFGMFAIQCGMALHGGIIPYAGTFLTFVDYGRNAVRLSAMMKLRVIYVLTHDSIGLGEDGPTHQPIEHANILRMTPNVNVWRPADRLETTVAWEQACTSQTTPSCLLLTRQAIPALEHSQAQLADIRRGAYCVSGADEEHSPDVILIATGSEVHLALTAAKQLAEHQWRVRVVSMPCADIFKAQSRDYQDQILPPDVRARIAIEAGCSDYWWQFVGREGEVIGIDTYGASAPAPELFKAKGFTPEAIVEKTSALLARLQIKRACGAGQVVVE